MFVFNVYWWLKTGSWWFLHQKCVTTYWKSVNKICIWILNCHIKNECKFEAFWFVFKSFCYTIFTNFPKKIGGGGETEKSPTNCCWRSSSTRSSWSWIGMPFWSRRRSSSLNWMAKMIRATSTPEVTGSIVHFSSEVNWKCNNNKASLSIKTDAAAALASLTFNSVFLILEQVIAPLYFISFSSYMYLFFE